VNPFTFVSLLQYIGGIIDKVKKIFVKVKKYFIVKFYPNFAFNFIQEIRKAGSPPVRFTRVSLPARVSLKKHRAFPSGNRKKSSPKGMRGLFFTESLA